jgi:2-isopropylmalate synthase
VEFREEIQRITDEEGVELPPKRIYESFMELYVNQPGARLGFVDHHTHTDPNNKGIRVVSAEITDNGETKRIEGRGTGPIDGFVNALTAYLGIDLTVANYSEHSMQHGSNAAAICYMQMETPAGKLYGAGVNTNIVAASLEAVVSAANRALAARG